MAITLFLGILNGCLGSLFTALGYCLQKLAHLNKPAEMNILKSSLYRYGLLSLILGSVSAVGNLGLLKQSVQAPLAALTLIYNAALAWKILGEQFTFYDGLSTIVILTGVSLAMIGATQDSQIEQFYTQEELLSLWSRDYWSLLFTAVILGSGLVVNVYIEQGRQKTTEALLCYSTSGGVMGGFTSLFIKSTIDLVKTGWRYDQLMSYACPIMIGVCILLQLRFMNSGLAHFGTLKFVPIYQSTLILSNFLCGIIFFDDFAQSTNWGIFLFSMGCLITLIGVTVLLFKVEEDDDYQVSLDPVIDNARVGGMMSEHLYDVEAGGYQAVVRKNSNSFSRSLP